jgi:hypothetical protein
LCCEGWGGGQVKLLAGLRLLPPWFVLHVFVSLSLSTTQQSLHLPVKGGQFFCEGLGGGQGKLLARLWLLPWFVLHMFAVAAVVK